MRTDERPSSQHEIPSKVGMKRKNSCKKQVVGGKVLYNVHVIHYLPSSHIPHNGFIFPC